MALLDFLFGEVDMPERERVDIGEVQDITESAAERNARRSRALEEELSPELAALRPEVFQSLLEGLRDDEMGRDTDMVRKQFLADIMGEDQLDFVPLEESELLQSAIGQAGEDLALGGRLSQDVRNEVLRNAIETSGAVGTSGRDITARDLGRSSQDLRNQRLQTATGLGQVEQQTNLQQQSLRNALNRFNAGLRQQQRQNRAGGLSFLEGLQGQAEQTALGAISATPEPIAGLDPGSVADIFVGDINAENAFNQQGAAIQAQQQAANSEFLGDLFGTAAQFATAPTAGGGSVIGSFFGKKKG